MNKPILIDEQTIQMLDRYASILRIAWLNPSDKDSQQAVHQFENFDHDEELSPFFSRWQAEFYGDIKEPAEFVFNKQKEKP